MLVSIPDDLSMAVVNPEPFGDVDKIMAKLCFGSSLLEMRFGDFCFMIADSLSRARVGFPPRLPALILLSAMASLKAITLINNLAILSSIRNFCIDFISHVLNRYSDYRKIARASSETSERTNPKLFS